MQSSMPIEQAIEKRYSCRTYTGESLTEDHQNELNNFLLKSENGIFQNTSRFKIAASQKDNKSELKSLGTYGFIKNPAGYIIGAVSKTGMNLEEYGYKMENIILNMTKIGINTCWLGGSFTRSTFSKKMDMEENEIMPAVASFGYGAKRPRVQDSLIRWSIKAKKRLSWEKIFFLQNIETPISNFDMNVYHKPLEMVRLAPSASNKQPWRIIKVKEQNVFHFFLKRSKGYQDRNSKYFKMEDMQRIDIGIAMCHFELTCLELGLKGKWENQQVEIDNLPHDFEYIITWVGKK